MKFIEQNIEGVYIISPEPYEDKRGMLRRHFCKKEFKKNELFTEISQTNISENKSIHTLRGFHFQYPPYSEDKVISCIAGSIYDIVVDLRKESKTYLKWESFNLQVADRLSLYVPSGCANAYLTTTKNSWILYYHSEFYRPLGEGGIRYNDPLFKFNWPVKPKVISSKDLSFSDWKED